MCSKGGRQRSILECPNKKSLKACRKVIAAKRAYTPLHGTEITFNQYFRLCWCFAYGEKQNNSRQLTKAGETQVAIVFSAFRDMTAWFIIRLGRGVQFKTAEVDMDAAKTMSSGLIQRRTFIRAGFFCTMKGPLASVRW